MKKRYFLIIVWSLMILPTFVKADTLECEVGTLGSNLACTYKANNVEYSKLSADVSFTNEGLTLVDSSDNMLNLSLSNGIGTFYVYVSKNIDLETVSTVQMTLSNIIFDDTVAIEDVLFENISIKDSDVESDNSDDNNDENLDVNPDDGDDSSEDDNNDDEYDDPIINDPSEDDTNISDNNNGVPSDSESTNNTNNETFINPSTGVFSIVMLFIIMVMAVCISYFYYKKIYSISINK